MGDEGKAGQGEGKLKRDEVAVTGLAAGGGPGVLSAADTHYSSGPPGSALCGSAYPNAFCRPRVCS
jgi:hypothetical protein